MGRRRKRSMKRSTSVGCHGKQLNHGLWATRSRPKAAADGYRTVYRPSSTFSASASRVTMSAIAGRRRRSNGGGVGRSRHIRGEGRVRVQRDRPGFPQGRCFVLEECRGLFLDDDGVHAGGAWGRWWGFFPQAVFRLRL